MSDTDKPFHADEQAEVMALIAALHTTERRLEEITGGQIDTVSMGSGTPFLLRRAQAELRQSEAAKQAAILNALPAHIALLNEQGGIVSVNETWRQFAAANAFCGPLFGITLNYLEVCDRARGEYSAEAQQAAAGIRAVLAGATTFSLEYPCHAPTEQRWFLLTVTPLTLQGARGAVVMHLNITERKRAELSLQTSERKQRLSAEQLEAGRARLVEAQAVANVGSWETDLASMKVTWSEEAHRIFETDPVRFEPTHEGFLQRVHPADRTRVDAVFFQSLGETAGCAAEHRLLFPDGRIKFIEERWRTYHNEQGKPIRVFGTCHDITERTNAENAVRESNEKFHQLAENITDAFWIRSPDLRTVYYVSPAFERIWGRTVASLYANPHQWSDFIFAEDRVRVMERFNALQADRSTLDIEYRIVRPDGEIRWVHTRGFHLRDANDQTIRHAGIVTDITDRRKVEDALRESERRFKALFEQAAVGVAQAEAGTGRFVQVNQRFADILGRTREELQQLTFTAITHRHDAAYDREKMAELKAGSIREYAREKRYIRKDGSEVWVSLTVSAMWAPGETPSLCIAVVQDISERKRLDQHFLQAQKMEALGQFSGGVAHDFNNILAAISGYTELSQMILKDNPAVREHLGSVMRASARAADLVRQILTFSRQQPQERRVIQLQPVVAESLKLMRATIPTGIEFDTEIATDTPTVLANANQVHQVLMNLGINASQAMKEGTGRLHVTLEKFTVDAALAAAQPRLRPGVYSRVSVSDTGCGMDAATLRRIFDPFFTTKPPGEGTGLGLAVVDGIMESHDGAVMVFSQPGEGTMFQLYFPAQAGQLEVAVRNEPPPPRGQGQCVLVVDDEDLLARLFQRSLEKLGYRSEMVTRPAEALALVRAEPGRFAAVLSDQAMPGMTGLMLAGELTQLRPGLPVVLITGYSAALTPDRLQAAGVRRLLLKPISLYDLAVAMQETLAEKT